MMAVTNRLGCSTPRKSSFLSESGESLSVFPTQSEILHVAWQQMLLHARTFIRVSIAHTCMHHILYLTTSARTPVYIFSYIYGHKTYPQYTQHKQHAHPHTPSLESQTWQTRALCRRERWVRAWVQAEGGDCMRQKVS